MWDENGRNNLDSRFDNRLNFGAEPLRPMHYVVMRRPSLQEDEGWHRVVQSHAHRINAENWIAAQSGYFSPSDYYIVETRDAIPVDHFA